MLTVNRRSILAAGAGMGAITALPGLAWAQAATDRRLIVVLQRGAADGLAIVAPTGDPAYRSARGALADVEGGSNIDSFFTLHPALAASRRMFAAREARFVHAVATRYRDRSHFDGQNLFESGGARPYARQDGWMNRLLTLLPEAERPAIALAQAVPLMLRGDVSVSSYAASRLPAASEDLTRRIEALYANDPLLHPIWQEAQRTRTLAGDIGANAGRGGAELGELAVRLMLPADGARVLSIETGGWDTHSGQQGRLAAQLRGLDALVDAVRTGLGPQWANTLMIVATEFGRTVAANGTGGTDHGTASAAMLFGGSLAGGGTIAADWPGLSPAALYEGRDLRPTTSLEAVIAHAVARHYALDPARTAAQLFPAA